MPADITPKNFHPRLEVPAANSAPSQMAAPLFGRSKVKTVHRRDGSVVVFGDNDDQDEIVAEAAVIAFIPKGASHCACGAPLHRWSLRNGTHGPEISCACCHRTIAEIELGVQVHR